MNRLLFCFVCLLARGRARTVDERDISKLRTELLRIESTHSLGGNLILTKNEARANEIIMKLKHKEVDESFANNRFNFSKHYFAYKDSIRESEVYKIIKKMPKGAALHQHSSAFLDADELLKFTYEDHLFVCLTETEVKFNFSATVPTGSCSGDWILLSDLRANSTNVTALDNTIKEHLTLVTNPEDEDLYDLVKIWKRFEKLHSTIKPLLNYRPVREKYFHRVLEKLYEDGIMYFEFRSGMSILKELDGSVHEKFHTVKLYKNITDKFIETHPDFVGFKMILTSSRRASLEKIRASLEMAKKFKTELPELYAGFDVVGQEDFGRPLADYLSLFNEFKQDVDYFFHGGETNWFGTPSDENLLDAVLLGAKRIGHGFALVKHPDILNVMVQRDIAVEVNLISNVVLALLTDIRQHPLATYLALGVPVVLSSDDPGTWGADMLSHDFYLAFVGVASRNYDLRLLKQLAINSIKYSALEDGRKANLMKVFSDKWSKFIEDVIASHS